MFDSLNVLDFPGAPSPALVGFTKQNAAREAASGQTLAELWPRRGPSRSWCGQATLALSALARQLAGAANRFGLLAGLLFGRLLIVVAELHLAENAFALKLLLQGAQRLIHIVVANNYLQA
jgi:hypothetical protein